MGRKGSKRGSSSSTNEESMAAQRDDCNLYKELKDSIECLKKLVTDGLAELHSDLDKLRYEFKAYLKEVKSSIKELEKSVEFTQGEANSLKEQVKQELERHAVGLEALHKTIDELELKLKKEVERNTSLQQYTRRENLRFNNITETEDEDCKALVCNIIEKDLGVAVSEIRFHAVHRVGRRTEGRCRPIIARFVCREDRDRVWSKKGKIKQSSVHPDAYIMEDYAEVIQDEWKKLIKAMIKAQEEHGLRNAKVKGRFLYINSDRYDHQRIPEYLK